MKKFVVVLAGGQGRRFKDITGLATPKQFFKSSNQTQNMVEQTVQSVSGIVLQDGYKIVVLTKELYEDYLKQCFFATNVDIDFDLSTTLATAPAIFHAVQRYTKSFGETVFAFLPTDQLALDQEYFVNLLSKVCRLAEKTDRLFVLGSDGKNESSNSTYIFAEPFEHEQPDQLSISHVNKIVQNPTLEELQAPNLLKSMGIVVGKSSAFLKAFLAASLEADNPEKKQIMLESSFDTSVLLKVSSRLVAVKYKSFWKEITISHSLAKALL